MTDGVNIDFGALKQPDYLGNYVNAFRVGQDLGKQSAIQNANKQFATNPQAGINAMTGQNAAPGSVMDLQARIDAMPEPARMQAAQRNEALTHVLIGLQGLPLEQRLGAARHLAQTSGLIDPGGITSQDVSDGGIDQHLAAAQNIAGVLARGRSAFAF